ncbi:helix-turn-helix domain-containing protein [Methylobacterium symbioticum]|uniref:Transcriptional activator FeaR n=1 Tax=Methylobacterium symbioticum TaxID=2584084 RepID=A0A509EB44_9HYPH|nr:helix-turn-helix domain-containing protein [Methylobacterium symbioticum]VUD70844.1 Transcriptional activator FeaR [Methylobacterium symbioticum]
MRANDTDPIRRDQAVVLCHRFDVPEDRAQLGSAWREHIAPFFQVSFRSDTDLSVPIAMRSYHLGELLVGDVIAPAHTLERTQTMVQQQGLDHILLQFYRQGHSLIEGDGGTLAARETDCVVFDLARPVRIVAAPVDATNLVIPRALLEDQGCRLEGLHARILDHDGDPFGRLLHAFLANVVACGDLLHQQEAASAARAIIQLCGTYLSGRTTGTGVQNLDARIRVRRLIERDLHEPGLTPAVIAARAGMSRSALYPLFGETGGVLAYIRDRRLMRAMRILVRGDAAGPRRVAQLAYTVGFSDEKTFQRAFRRRFGFVPSETTSYQLGIGGERAGISVLRSWIDNL